MLEHESDSAPGVRSTSIHALLPSLVQAGRAEAVDCEDEDTIIETEWLCECASSACHATLPAINDIE
jgi:hypothetical protein